MPRSRRVATTALVGGGATFGGFYGVLVGEAVLARRAIGTSEARPPSADGVYGDDLPGRIIRCLVLGDSAAVGYGMTSADATPTSMIGQGLAHVLDATVDMRCHAVVGAQTSDLMAQIDLAASWEPQIAVIIVGTNDVTHQVLPRTSARLLAEAVTLLVESGCEVVVGTCPDLGTILPIPQPLRLVARGLSRHLARKQTVAAVGAGARAVSMGDLLGPMFTAKRDIMFGADHFHPSETGYANIVSVLIPAMAASWRERETNFAYADHTRELVAVADAAAVAAKHAGTQVVPNGRWARVLRRGR